RGLIGACDEVGIVFVTQPSINREVGSGLPAVVKVELRPICMRVFSAAADAHLSLRGIAQHKIGEWIPGTGAICCVRTIVGVDAARVVWKRRLEVEVEEVRSCAKTVAATVDQDVIE